MERIAGTRFRAPGPCRVGVAWASESGDRPNRWLLVLDPDMYDGFVLLCEDRYGQEHRFVASGEFAARVLPELSRDKAGQITFHVTREDGCMYLDVPGGRRLSIELLRDAFVNLADCGGRRCPNEPAQRSVVAANEPKARPQGRAVGTGAGRGAFRQLGRRGNENLHDYLLPVIGLMRSGVYYQEAFRRIAEKLDVRYNTVASQCTRMLGMTTDEFVEQVRTGRIESTLRAKFPDREDEIRDTIRAGTLSRNQG